MAKVAVLLLALPALLAGCLAGASPPVPSGQIDGAVVDHLLRPFANQTVYLSQLGWKDSTSGLGGFTFRHVPVGSYTLLSAHEGTRGAAVTVEVQDGRITKVILQLLPIPVAQPSLDIVPHTSREPFANPHQPCTQCTWTQPLGDEHPAEVILEAQWVDSVSLGRDNLRFKVVDARGDLLYSSPTAMASPLSISIPGADIPTDAEALTVLVTFGPDFTPQPDFHMESVLSIYYGATKAQLFQQ